VKEKGRTFDLNKRIVDVDAHKEESNAGGERAV